ncbi:MAG: hypothetical protein K1000chlam2_00704 [Chlamydiae bacterium]|nr:hypothetical protein [Chlamydiota bacterium]
MKDLEIRASVLEDGEMFKRVLLEPEVLQYFPMYNVREIDDSVRIWEIFCKKDASLTSLIDGTPCGIAFLNLQAYKKFAHQCIISVVVSQNFRNRGVGTALMEELFKMSKEKFHLEMLHLEVYANNPALRLYQRLGFKEFGLHKKFIKDKGQFIGKIFMEREL